MKIGSHVSMGAPNYFLGSVKEALNYNASALMLYTGAPQNSKRVPIEKLQIEEGINLWNSKGLDNDSIVVHAPYIINLANTLKLEKLPIAKEILLNEIRRTKAMHAKYLVLHPGSCVGQDKADSIKQVSMALNEILAMESGVVICLETMAGKGSEIGSDFEELGQIINQVNFPIGVCLDSCHVNDAGYNLDDIDELLEAFDQIIGLDKLHVVHVNDSKNPRGSHCDRHANIGEGTIGLEKLRKIVHHPKLQHCIFILETPYVEGKPIYGKEIEMLK